MPYNVQQLAHMCWERLRTRPQASLTNKFVDESLNAVVAMENSPYTQLWTSLTATQRTMVRAVMEEGGRRLRSNEVLSRYAMPSSTATRTLRALDERGIVREEEDGDSLSFGGSVSRGLAEVGTAGGVAWRDAGVVCSAQKDTRFLNLDQGSSGGDWLG